MTWTTGTLGVALFGAVLAGAMMARAEGEAALDPLPWQDGAAVARGEALYAAHCAACHGAALEGEANWRVADEGGYLPAPPHNETGHTWHHPSPVLIDITRRGTAAVVGGGYRSRMPGFGEVLTDREILEVLAYVKSTWPERIRQIHTQRTEAYVAATGDRGL